MRRQNVWIEKRKTQKGLRYDLRWWDPLTGEKKGYCTGGDSVRARMLAVEKMEGLARGETAEKIRPRIRKLSDLIAALPEWLAGKSYETLRVMKRAIEELKAHVGDVAVARVDRSLTLKFRAHRVAAGLSLATVNKELRQIKTSLSNAAEVGWIETNPLYRWSKLFLREPERVVRVIEAKEFDQLTGACEWEDFTLVLMLAYYQGLRRKEIAQLRWEAVNFAEEMLSVVNVPEAGELTKSRKNRIVPMRAPVVAEIQKQWHRATKVLAVEVKPKWPHVFHWDDGRPLQPDWITHEFARVAERAGVTACTIHDLRRSFSTLAQRQGIDRAVVKDLGGWSTIGVVEKHYTGELGKRYRDAVKKLDAG